ncbi:hypothetical protein MRI28_09535 [Nocardiopsis dassonvillei]|uniref:hypothetical protein n=1 Tax=Nocardiopsis dassonvillei TaxID=2014 RepID=UPI00200F7AA3|nr:hypothetical protein [Nocardiopsis dassonvillei]MCK9869888.1 hypothetical protein [Nocardiopsis dassonvillei]
MTTHTGGTTPWTRCTAASQETSTAPGSGRAQTVATGCSPPPRTPVTSPVNRMLARSPGSRDRDQVTRPSPGSAPDVPET